MRSGTTRAGTVAPIPMGRMAKPSEVAAETLFLLSDEASYVAGAVLCFDVGLRQVKVTWKGVPGLR